MHAHIGWSPKFRQSENSLDNGNNSSLWINFWFHCDFALFTFWLLHTSIFVFALKFVLKCKPVLFCVKQFLITRVIAACSTAFCRHLRVVVISSVNTAGVLCEVTVVGEISFFDHNLYPVFRASTFRADRNNGCPLQEPYTRMQRYAFRWVCTDWVRMLANVIRIWCCFWHTQSDMLGLNWHVYNFLPKLPMLGLYDIEHCLLRSGGASVLQLLLADLPIRQIIDVCAWFCQRNVYFYLYYLTKLTLTCSLT